MPGNMVHEQQAAVATAWQADAPRVAVLLPCYNEEAAIARVVRAFREALPQAQVYVYDNASSDRPSVVAAEAGAVVVQEPLRGQGNVVRRMFADIDADIYVLPAGDDTYAHPAAHRRSATPCREPPDLGHPPP